MAINLTKSSLLIIGYYHLADGFRACANYLEKDYDVYFFPLSHYHGQGYDVKNELIKYINGEKCDKYECGLRESNPPMGIVLIWYFNYFIENRDRLNIFVSMKNEVKHRVIYLGYNWDPKPPEKEISCFQMGFIQLLNCYLTGDGREITYLKEKGEYNYVYCPSGFDPKITYYVDDPTHSCDVSIICTNLYMDYDLFPRKYVRVHRKEMIDLIYNHRNEIKFHIYGPKEFQELYPECYRGYINYSDCPKVFSNSKINLCIHATSYNNVHNYIYFSERLPQIMGARGLVYCDTEYNYLLEPNVNYILADAQNPLGQIKEILQNYDNPKYRLIKEKGYELANKYFTWDNVRNKVKMIDNRMHMK